ncbi:MAG: SLC26A/SulP transporter family protein [Pyrinomonadaceae bacterium]|nr:SLC26A/SulP transporter family protein [Pyrinomonadaceae bacterium]
MTANIKNSILADIWGGIAAAAMLLPQSMAFGVVLLTPYGISAGIGALAGLIGAAALSIASGLAGGTKGIISSPTGPMLILFTSALAMIAANSKDTGFLLLGMLVLVVSIGVVQVLIGLSGGGKLIKFIPYSVVVGFMTGSAVLMLISQIGPLSVAGGDPRWASWIWLPPLVAAATFLITYLLPKFTKTIPATIAGLIGGTALFHGFLYFAGAPAPKAWTIGQLPGLESINLAFDPALASNLPWAGLAIAAIAGAVLASLDTLLTAVIADVVTGTRHSARRELVGQGFGHIFGGLAGGIAGAGTTGATVVAVNSGGRRWAGLAAGITILAIVWFGGSIGTILPIAVLAGIIIRVSVGMIEQDILTWLKERESRADAIIAVSVTVVTVFYDLMAAVGLGVFIAIIMYIRDQVKAPVIHRRFSGIEVHSVRHRTHVQREALLRKGSRIVGCELRGDLFFATADQLYEELVPDLEPSTILILNLRRVRRVDLTGAKILQQLGERLHAGGGTLAFCEVHEGIGLGHDVAEALLRMSPDSSDAGVKTLIGMDEALEYAENILLEEDGLGDTDIERRVDVVEMEILADLSKEMVEALRESFEFRTYSAGDVVFDGGEDGSELFFVASGQVDIRLVTTEHHYKRLATYPAGTVFGEVAFLSPGPRSAGAVAVSATELAVLDQAHFEKLSESHPAAAIALIRGLSKLQSEELRWSAQELQRLGDW